MTDNLCQICSGLFPDAIFVFGSNEAGIHGAGAAAHARQFHGAEISVGFGPRETSWAIPTKDWNVNTLDLHTIQGYVNAFLRYAKIKFQTQFWVTRIGCGFAGYKDSDIAPLFVNAPKNVELPIEWEQYVR